MSNARILSKLGNIPAFSAYPSSGTAITGSTTVKINFQTEEYDTTSAYDNSTSRFNPKVEGLYQITGAVQVNGTTSSMFTGIAKNGTLYRVGSYHNLSSTAPISVVSGQVYLNGTTDYVEIFAYSGSTLTTQVSSSNCYFQGYLVKAF